MLNEMHDNQDCAILRSTLLEAARLRSRTMAKIHEVNVLFFVGAGASVPFGYQTTDQFISEIRNMPLEQSEREILDFYVQTPNITIEDIIRALDIRIKESDNALLRREALSPLRTAQVSPSVAPDADLKSKLESETKELIGGLEKRFSAYKTLKDKIVKQLYSAYADKTELVKVWEVYGDYVHILREQNNDMLPIFTTNYDKVIESLENIAESDINQVVRGFTEQKKGMPKNPIWAPEEVFAQGPKADRLYLFKLHGSLNWRRDIHNQLRETEEGQFEMRGFWKENMLVPPGTIDYRYGEPYHSLRIYLEGYLGQAQTCVVIGYRFDDPTIRDTFVRCLEQGSRLILLSPEAEKIKAAKFLRFENIVCIPKKIEEGVEDVREALGVKKHVTESIEVPVTVPESENIPTSTPE